MNIWSISLCLILSASASLAGAPEKTSLSGSWKMYRSIFQGKEIPAKSMIVTRTFDSSSFVVRGLGSQELARADYVADEGVTPKTIEVKYKTGKWAGKTLRGIFEISGDDLKIYMAAPGKPAPASFEAVKASEMSLDFYRREK